MRRIIIILALALSLPALAQVEGPDSLHVSVQNAIVDAVAQLEAGDFNIAESSLDSLATTNPDDDAVQYFLGTCHYARGAMDKALQCFQRAEALDSTNLWYKEVLASIYVSRGDADAARRTYGDLTRMDPRRFISSYTLTLVADAYRVQRNYPGMFRTLREFAVDPTADADARFEYIKNAVTGYDSRTLNTIMPSIDSLLTFFIEAEPQCTDARELLLQVKYWQKDWDGVIGTARGIIAVSPDNPEKKVDMLSVIGDVEHQRGNVKQAYRIYEEALAIDPRKCSILNNYAYFLSQEKRKLKKAAEMSLITVQEEPDNATFLDTYGWILYLRHKSAEAKPYFKHAMIYGGKDSSVVLRHYALVLEDLGETDLAKYYHGLADAREKAGK